MSGVIVSSLLFAACGTQAPEPASTPAESAAGGPTQRPYANLAQMMRAIPFPNSNIIFDAGSEDPEERKKAAEGGAGGGGSATANFGNVYAGWQQVENAALALSETANLLLIPGRMCENGKPAPTDREDYRKFVAQLAEAGEQAYKAAQSKNLDTMLEVGGTVTEACSACHEVYRDKEDNADRCTPPAAE
jgi:hypothetical protein